MLHRLHLLHGLPSEYLPVHCTSSTTGQVVVRLPSDIDVDHNTLTEIEYQGTLKKKKKTGAASSVHSKGRLSIPF